MPVLNTSSIPSSRQRSWSNFRYVWVFPVCETLVSIKDGHPAAEATHGLREFQADETSAEDQETLREVIQFESFNMRQWLRFGKAGNGFNVARVPVLMMTFFREERASRLR